MKAEEAYAKDGTLPDPNSTDNPEFKIVLGLIRDGLAADPKKVLARCAVLRLGVLCLRAALCCAWVCCACALHCAGICRRGFWLVACCMEDALQISNCHPSASSAVAPHGREDCGRV